MKLSLRTRDININTFDIQSDILSFPVENLKVQRVILKGRATKKKITLPFNIKKGYINIDFDLERYDIGLDTYNIFLVVFGFGFRVKMQAMLDKTQEERYINLKSDLNEVSEFLYFSIKGRMTYHRKKQNANGLGEEKKLLLFLKYL